MNLDYSSLLPQDFPPSSKVWVYQSNRLFSMQEALQIEDMLEQFVSTWQSHGDPVRGFATLFYGQFIILMADESATGVSGCSTDSSVRLIKQVEKEFGVNMFDRQLLAFIKDDRIQLLPLSQFIYACQYGFVEADTFYFNNTVLNKEELQSRWIIPVKESWLKNRIPAVTGH